ncbi:AraC family transcriptional regulator [Xanthobacter sp. KR7-225]|uniref:helix-turn-helix transcriptional regulator n=1 Tax=Xanthobacter sp. KR7-225 TaxID=3156613 RepID=UPI0032B42FD0
MTSETGNPAGGAAATARIAFSSRDLPDALTPAQKAAMWIEAASNAALRLDIDCPDRDRFYGACDTLAVGQFVVTVAEANAVRVSRRAAHIAQDGNDSVMMLYHLRGGPVEGRQYGREIRLGAGEAAFFDSKDEQMTQARDGGRVLGLYAPRRVLRDCGIEVEGLVAKPFSVKDNEALRMLVGYLDVLRGSAGASASLAECVSRHIADLLTLAVGRGAEVRERASGGLRAARLAAIHREIACHAHRPGFGVDHVGKALALSPRYIQRLLHEEGTTFSAQTMEHRLAMACRALAGTQEGLADIAFRCGFGDLSVFYRAFKRKFGMSPGRFRRL